MTTALLLIDIQNDYFPDGKMSLVNMDAAANQAKRLLHIFREKNLSVIHIQHVATRPNANFFLPDTEGVKIHEAVTPLKNECVIQKHYPNSFRETKLLEQLKALNINDLVIAGAMSHMCIDATTRAAFDLGFACTVIEDACATKNLNFVNREVQAADVHAAFMSALSYVYAKVLKYEEYKAF